MTRQEYKDKLIKGHEQTISVAMNIALTIDKIFDDLESRVCENCKFCSREGFGGFVCTNEEIANMSLSGWRKVNKNFGCNKFERREND